MIQSEKAAIFESLHVKGEPLLLYNVWDAGGAKAIANAGAKANATSSWSVAAAHGFEDGEAMPLEFLLQIIERISTSVDLPLTVDFEGGYASDPETVTDNVRKIIDAGAIGINFEDQVVQGEDLYPISVQFERIKAVRKAAEMEGVNFFINARTDLFLGSDSATHESFITEAIERESAYADAGADGFFIPGLTSLPLISQIIDTVSLPVNIMITESLNPISDIARIGVSRISYGPGPYFSSIKDLTDRYNSPS